MAKLLKRKNMDFYAAYYRKPPLEKAEVRKRLIFGIPGGAAAIMLLAGGVVYCQVIYKNHKISEISTYLRGDDIVSSYKEASVVEKDRRIFEEEIQYFTGVNSFLDTYPKFSSDDITRVYGCATGGTSVKGLNYDCNTGVLTLTAEAPKHDYAAQTVTALRNLGIFSEVSYEGYESGSDGVYYFDAFCFQGVQTGQEGGEIE